MEERGRGPVSWKDKGCFGDVRLQRTRGSRNVALWGPGGGGGSSWEREEKYKEGRVGEMGEERNSGDRRHGGKVGVGEG